MASAATQCMRSRTTGAPDQSTVYTEQYRQWWDFVGEFHLDRDAGSWWHELDPAGEVSHTVWDGKADIYHAFQATLLPRLPLSPSLATSLRAGHLA